MGLSAEVYARQLQQLLPQGAAWDVQPGSRMAQLLLGIGEELARIDARAGSLVDEWDPRTTYELLVEWERMLGLPDPCVTGEQTIAQRRAAVIAKYTSLGGQTPAYYIALAAALGYSVTITEFTPYDIGDDVDAPIEGDAWAYAWQVNAALNTVGEQTVDDGADEPLAWWGNEALECVLDRLKPAHTYLLFAYTAGGPTSTRYWPMLALTTN